ncbi:Polysaccharide deacetylase [Klenkia soli]|uniref:Polysaccharide deacetylase n=1 Tax=Klenkia soli TaxID=1052260 RepID=A0A1H0J3B9_9ACTN|nr:polysaccharide deacetylase family protein [Klenkia soli]SDO37939.1 Polysaccharide deacetylase [Klenkia soli]
MTRQGSVSLDADNLWSYLKTHGDSTWEARPSYLDALRPRLLDLYGRHGITGTVFVVGHDAAKEDGQRLVSEMAAAGHEVANHSYEHEPWLHLYDRGQLEAELDRTEQAVVDAGAPRPVGFRGPGYSLSPELLELLAERGYEYDATTLPTWIGPLARAYYFKTSQLPAEELDQRVALFGSASEVLRPVKPYRWDVRGPASAAGLAELPVTTMPLARVPVHASYVLHAHSVNPRLAKLMVAAAVRACLLTGTAPSLLLHPLDLLDAADAPGLEFFPGMQIPAAEKARVLDHLLRSLTKHWTLGQTRAHAAALPVGGTVLGHDTAGPGSTSSRVRALLRR